MAADARPDDEASKLSDTIFALSSGLPPAAIAVIRISGPAAHDVLESLCGPLPPPRRASLREIRHRSELVDRALVIRFPGPDSVTGEDVVELHLHGGRAIVAAALAALAEHPGLRPALPGEFTRRAFENGRLDLAEAEGLADLLAAETESQRRAALAMAGGALSRRVESWQQRLLALGARIEAALDFSDEEDVGAADHDLGEEIGALAAELAAFLAQPAAERLRDGIKVVIAGPPNSGKSTLLNALVEREAAITSALAGTTRDLVEAPVAFEGIPFLLVDTAGLRNSEDMIEAIGVERARRALEAADLVLWLGEPAAAPARPGMVIVQSKGDRREPDPQADLTVSGLTGENLPRLVDRLVRDARRLLPAEGEIAANARQRIALAATLRHLSGAAVSGDSLIVAEELRLARSSLDQVTGRAGVEDMLDALFGRFCLGK